MQHLPVSFVTVKYNSKLKTEPRNLIAFANLIFWIFHHLGPTRLFPKLRKVRIKDSLKTVRVSLKSFQNKTKQNQKKKEKRKRTLNK